MNITSKIRYKLSKLKKQGFTYIVGVDSVGDGALAGPIIASAVYLQDFKISKLDDSKKIPSNIRDIVAKSIVQKGYIGLGAVDPPEIAKENILQASLKAMLLAVLDLKNHISVDYVLIDGRFELPGLGISQEAIIKGDSLFPQIAAASVIAKVTRDKLMQSYHKYYPDYGFDAHVGYGTKKHIDALKRHGPCNLHRMNFEKVQKYMRDSLPYDSEISSII